jgi:hypothetical protein
MQLLVLILVVLGLVCFALEAFAIVTSKWSLLAAGLFFVTLAMVLSDTVFRTGINL